MLPALYSHGPLKAGRTIACSLALLACVTLAPSRAATADDALAPVMVVALQGDVTASADNHPVALKIGSAVPLPVTVNVGKGASLELHQGRTVIRAAENSRLELPQSHDAAETLDRVVQSSGNVLYNVAKRPVHKLQIGTPYLVAVIKGTQFNVSVQPDSVTLSLLEGRIELHSSKSADVVQMESGQMAISSQLSPAIRVVNMTTGDILRSGRPQANQVAAATTGAATTAVTATSGSTATTASAAVTTQAATVSNIGLAATSSTTVTTKSQGAGAAQVDDRGASSVLMLNGMLAHASASAGTSADTTGAGAATGPAGPSAPTGSSPAVTGGTGTGPSGPSAPTGPSPPVTAGAGTGPSAPGTPAGPSPPVTAGTGTAPSGPGAPTEPSPPVTAGTGTAPSGPSTPTGPSPPVTGGTGTGPSAPGAPSGPTPPVTAGTGTSGSTPGDDGNKGPGNSNGNSGKGSGNSGKGKGNGGPGSLQAELQALLGKLKK